MHVAMYVHDHSITFIRIIKLFTNEKLPIILCQGSCQCLVAAPTDSLQMSPPSASVPCFSIVVHYHCITNGKIAGHELNFSDIYVTLV